MKYLSLFFVVVFFFGCIKVETPPNTPLYSVYCVISPQDSIITAFVAKTYQIGDKISFNTAIGYDKAQVSISDGLQKLNLVFNKETNNYEAINKKFIRPKTRYNLEIKTPDISMNATCFVPALWNNIEFKESGKGNDYEFYLQWLDDVDEENYYTIIGKASEKQNDENNFYTIKWSDNTYYSTNLNDKNKNGKNIISPTGSFQTYGDNNINFVLLEFLNMDKNMGIFEAKYKEQSFSDDFTNKFKDPIIIPTNIQNGTGLFGGYTKQKMIKSIAK